MFARTHSKYLTLDGDSDGDDYNADIFIEMLLSNENDIDLIELMWYTYNVYTSNYGY